MEYFRTCNTCGNPILDGFENEEELFKQQEALEFAEEYGKNREAKLAMYFEMMACYFRSKI